MAENDTRDTEALQEVLLRKSVTQTSNEDLTEVIGELALSHAVTLADIAAFENSCAWCFQAHRVELIQLFLSRDHKRAVMVFRAPDAESVRMVCRRAAMPIDLRSAGKNGEHVRASPTGRVRV